MTDNPHPDYDAAVSRLVEVAAVAETAIEPQDARRMVVAGIETLAKGSQDDAETIQRYIELGGPADTALRAPVPTWSQLRIGEKRHAALVELLEATGWLRPLPASRGRTLYSFHRGEFVALERLAGIPA